MKTIFDPRKLRKLFRPRRGTQVARRRSLELEKRRQHLVVTLRALDDSEKRSRKNMKKNPVFAR